MIIAGPCLLNNNEQEIENTIKTAKMLYAIDSEIMFRCKLWGGGTTPEKYKEGYGEIACGFLHDLSTELNNMSVGTEIHNYLQARSLELTGLQYRTGCFIWIGARNCQNYTLLSNLKLINKGWNIFIKRGTGMTIDELIGIHDICRDIHDYKPIMIERGINTFCRTDKRRWMPDFHGMVRLLQERPDIELMFDPSHACGCKEDIFPMIKAACAIGVKHFMMEVYADPNLTQTDKAQALSISEFKPIYDYIQKNA